MSSSSPRSKIPTSCTQTESTVIAVPLETVWRSFRGFAFEKIAPNQVTSTEYEDGGQEGVVGAVVKVTYQDGSVWRLRLTEYSERRHVLAYEVVSTEPPHGYASSVQGELTFQAVTTDNHTYVTWTTEFSNDADLTVITDQKYKKQEFFKDVKSNLVAP